MVAEKEDGKSCIFGSNIFFHLSHFAELNIMILSVKFHTILSNGLIT